MNDYAVGAAIILLGAWILGMGTLRAWIRKRREAREDTEIPPPPPPRAGKHGIDIDYE